MSEKQNTAVKESPRAQPTDFHLAEQVRVIYRHYTPVGIEKKHVLEPAYWTIISRQLKPGDVIECFAQDGTHYGQLLVLAADRAYAKVHVLSWDALSTVEVSESQDFKIEYKGIKMRHCVVRLSDGEVLHQGAQTKDEAQAWLADREKNLTA